MITLDQYDAEVAAIKHEMDRTRTPDDVQEKVLTILSRLRERLWLEAR